MCQTKAVIRGMNASRRLFPVQTVTPKVTFLPSREAVLHSRDPDPEPCPLRSAPQALAPSRRPRPAPPSDRWHPLSHMTPLLRPHPHCTAMTQERPESMTLHWSGAQRGLPEGQAYALAC